MSNSTPNSTSNPEVFYPRYFIPRNIRTRSIDFYNGVTTYHRDLLSSISSDASQARPLMFITVLPEMIYSEHSSSRNNVIEARYDEINRELDAIRSGDLSDEAVEAGAIDTAKALVAQIRKREIAPPELNLMGTEAIIMLWVVGQKKLALTITDGEFGYTIRDGGKTLKRVSNIAPDKLDVLKIR